MFQINFHEGGNIKFTLIKPASNLKFDINGEITHEVDLDIGESVIANLDKGAYITILADENAIQTIKGTQETQDNSKLLTEQATKDRYLEGETWILEFENEIEEVLSQ